MLPFISKINCKIIQRIVYDQPKCYICDSIVTDLTQITDDWLRSIDEKKMVCVALLNFTAPTDITDRDILLRKLECHGSFHIIMYEDFFEK